jgi:hypothetical protein
MGKATNPKRSKGGRPRQEGDRYACGKLKPVGPNPVVVAQRQALCDDPTKATNPLDVMLANRWMTEDQHRTARRFAEDRARVDFGGPNVPTAKDLSAPEGVDARDLQWTNLSHAEIEAIWDSALGRTPPPANVCEDADRRAWERYQDAVRSMTREQHLEVQAVVLHDSWPQWVIQRRAGRFGTSWERKRDLLLSGINAMMEAVYDRKARAA